MADDHFPDERLLLGLIAHNIGLLHVTHVIGLRAEHFRDHRHADIYAQALPLRDRSRGPFHIEKARNSKTELLQYFAELADAAAGRARDDEHAEIIVQERARKIISGIRNTEDRAKWYEQLFQACGRREIGAGDHLLGIAIGRHVKHATGTCYPGNELLAKESGLSLRSVERSIPILSKTRHLQVGRGRPLVFSPIVWTKLEAAKQAIECKQPIARAEPALLSPTAAGIEDEPSF